MTAVMRAETRWTCPNCPSEDVTFEWLPHSRFHTCRGLKGLTAPMVPDGTKCKIEAHERDDYVGRDLVTTDGEGRPIMSITTTRDTGQDCVVFAPCARASSEEYG